MWEKGLEEERPRGMDNYKMNVLRQNLGISKIRMCYDLICFFPFYVFLGFRTDLLLFKHLLNVFLNICFMCIIYTDHQPHTTLNYILILLRFKYIYQHTENLCFHTRIFAILSEQE